MPNKILVIDDTLVIRELLREFFTESGFEVETADEGTLGYKKALDNDYALIICDIHMPGMSGVDIVIELKKAKPETKIIVTDSMPGKSAELATASGALGCLPKPFDLNELRSITRSILGYKKSVTK
jgi:two-component system response regulator ResD